MRRFAIGDTHGCAMTLSVLLWEVLKVKKEDEVYFLGDYIDRGPDSRRVIEIIAKCQEDGYNFNPVMGNHESWLLEQIDDGRCDSDWLTWGGRETLDSFDARTISEIPQKYVDWMRNLPLKIVVDDYVFVHAGLNYMLADPINNSSDIYLLWDRTNHKANRKELGGRSVIYGHTPETIETIRFHIGQNSCKQPLDNCVYSNSRCGTVGNLVAFDLDSRELYHQPAIDLIEWMSPRMKKWSYAWEK